ncbi:MAG: 4-alpha-glucanotransferase, partial [Clostridia bacterium]|nr:4-alpha-glucanotransferase [Clostridia bacterium]
YVWELDDNTRREVLSYCGYESEDWDSGYDSIIRTMLSSHAGVVILPIQDLLHFGSDTRLNRPGSADGNWEYRVLESQLMRVDREKYKHWNYIYNRV